MRDHPPGLVAVIAQETGRYTAFTASLAALELPAGSRVEVSTGNERGPQRNQLVEFALHEGLEWVWFVDDDHVFGPDVVERLLAWELEVVQALCLMRRKPFPPAAFQTLNEEETHGDYLDLAAMTIPRLVEVASAGTAGMLIRTAVFERLERPWFRQDDFRSEDIRFCERLRDAGVPIHVDCLTVTGHLTTCAIWPVFEEGWKVGFQVGGSYQLKVPIESRPKLVLAR